MTALANVGRQRPRSDGTPDADEAQASEVPECSGSLDDTVRFFAASAWL